MVFAKFREFKDRGLKVQFVVHIVAAVFGMIRVHGKEAPSRKFRY